MPCVSAAGSIAQILFVSGERFLIVKYWNMGKYL